MEKIDSLTAELLSRPLSEFTQRRNTLAKQLKASGQAELAGRLSALKKPSQSLWAVNRLAVQQRPLLAKLRGAGLAVVKAQAGAAAGRPDAARELRAASAEFQRQLEADANLAAAGLRPGPRPAGEGTPRGIYEILRLAALASGETWDRLESGALISEPRAADDMLSLFGATGPVKGRQADRAAARREEEHAERAARADVERARDAEATAKRVRAEAIEAAAAAKRAAARAKVALSEATRARAQAARSARALRNIRPV